ncbi:hypothetical protein C0585_05520 [Candidatus Woesearchaeota archaeon]|nr:MAG: hypothetical protein C0585_05520 [Candidatus Woesearchaeota archaeon]
MNKIVKTDILSVLDNSLRFIDSNDYISLKDMSNHVIHNASIFQDTDSINIAVLIYSISKIFYRDKDMNPKIVRFLRDAKGYLFNSRYKDYEKTIKKLYKAISKEDSKIGMYIGEVIEMAEVKKGSKIYDHGISLAQSAEILGISQWELMDYIGKTKISDSFEKDGEVKKRLEFAKSLFKL